MNKNIVSKCCKAPLKVVGGDEGTNHFECTKCHKAADMYSGDKVNANKPKDQSAILEEKEISKFDALLDAYYQSAYLVGLSIDDEDAANRMTEQCWEIRKELLKELSLAEQRGVEKEREAILFLIGMYALQHNLKERELFEKLINFLGNSLKKGNQILDRGES